MRYPIDAKESFEEDVISNNTILDIITKNPTNEEDIISNNNILDIITKNPTTDKNLSIKDEKKEKLKTVEGDVIQGVS